jgi:4,5-DOPA dioxygenase extradiol
MPSILEVISAQYEKENKSVTSNEKLKTIHDFYEYPQEFIGHRLRDYLA